MGWVGLALAWHLAGASAGPWGHTVALFDGLIAMGVFGALIALSIWRGWRHPDALRDDVSHPVNHAFVAIIPVVLILLATWSHAVLSADFGVAKVLANDLWRAGSLMQLGVTAWVATRWARARRINPWARRASVDLDRAGLDWHAVTPLLIIPVVGNVLVPLVGVGLGHGQWSAWQFGIGLAFWPVVMAMVIRRLLRIGPLPEALQPTLLILVAPPSVIGAGWTLLSPPAPGDVPWLAWCGWALAASVLVWIIKTQALRILRQPFALPHWAMTFPLAALTGLSWRLSRTHGGDWLTTPALVLLGLNTLLVSSLSIATLLALRRGALLKPEAVVMAPSSALSPSARTRSDPAHCPHQSAPAR